MELLLNRVRKIYFIGIGGIGMSALARYFLEGGVEVFGYDKVETALTKKLVEEGMKIHYEENLQEVPSGINLVVYTPAIPPDHRELVYFREKELPVLKRAEVLGVISREKRTIAIAGTHGKTTTSALATHILRSGGIDCTAFLGGISTNLKSNFVLGQSKWVVAEADEYDRSFLHLHPEIAAVMSMDADHLEIYGDKNSLHSTGFKAFLKKVKKGGTIFLNAGLEKHFTEEEVLGLSQKLVTFKRFGVEKSRRRAKNLRVTDGYYYFDFQSEEHSIENIRSGLPGRHNVENATAAISIALELGVEPEKIKRSLATFQGIKRRIERIFQDDDRVYFDDYAHHPEELKAVIQTGKELFPGRKITGVFQPHLYTRTQNFAGEFASALDKLDEIILLPIYPAREKPIPGVSSRMLLDGMKNPNKCLVEKQDLIDELRKRKIQVLLTLGAGDIDRLVEPINNLLRDETD